MAHNIFLEALNLYDLLMYKIEKCVAENDYEEVKNLKEKFSKEYKKVCAMWKNFCRDRLYDRYWFLGLEVEHIEIQKRISDLETKRESASQEVGSAAMEMDVVENGIGIKTSDIIYTRETEVLVPPRTEENDIKVAVTEDLEDFDEVADTPIEMINIVKQVTCGYCPAVDEVEVANVGPENVLTEAPEEKDVDILHQVEDPDNEEDSIATYNIFV